MGVGDPKWGRGPLEGPKMGVGDPRKEPKWELGTPGRTQNKSWGPMEGPQMGPGTPGVTQNGVGDPKWGRGPLE